MTRAWPVHSMARHAHEMDAAAPLARHITRRGRIHTNAQVQLPLAGRELVDYDCKPTERGNTILSDWSRCKKARVKSEL